MCYFFFLFSTFGCRGGALQISIIVLLPCTLYTVCNWIQVKQVFDIIVDYYHY